MPDDDLAGWIEAVDRLDRTHPPTAEEMQAVGRDLGLSDALIQHARHEAERLRTRGARFLDNGLPREAVEVLETARSLEPWSLEGLEQLGRAHLEIYRQTGADSPRQSAELAARALIDAVPDGSVGYELLQGLKSRRRRLPSGVLWGLGGLAAGVLLTALLLPAATPTSLPDGSADTRPTERPVVGDVIGDLPAEIRRGALPDGVLLSVDDITVTEKTGGTGWFVRVGLLAENTVPLVLEEVQLDVRVVDADGHLVVAHDLALIGQGPSLYTGDRRGDEVLAQSSSTAGRPAGVVVEVKTVRSQPGSRGPGEPTDVVWAIPKLRDVDVAVELREGGTCRPSGQRTFCSGIYTVTNAGTVPIESLQLSAALGESGSSVTTWAASSSAPPLRPGDRQPFRVIRFIDGPPPTDPWVLSVVRVDTP